MKEHPSGTEVKGYTRDGSGAATRSELPWWRTAMITGSSGMLARSRQQGRNLEE
jgi:hypothetical protein